MYDPVCHASVIQFESRLRITRVWSNFVTSIQRMQKKNLINICSELPYYLWMSQTLEWVNWAGTNARQFSSVWAWPIYVCIYLPKKSSEWD